MKLITVLILLIEVKKRYKELHAHKKLSNIQYFLKQKIYFSNSLTVYIYIFFLKLEMCELGWVESVIQLSDLHEKAPELELLY